MTHDLLTEVLDLQLSLEDISVSCLDAKSVPHNLTPYIYIYIYISLDPKP